MAFTKQTAQVPTSVGHIKTELLDRDGTVRDIVAHFEVLDQDGNQVKLVTIKLGPHLPASTLNTINDFMNYLRNKGTSELLP